MQAIIDLGQAAMRFRIAGIERNQAEQGALRALGVAAVELHLRQARPCAGLAGLKPRESQVVGLQVVLHVTALMEARQQLNQLAIIALLSEYRGGKAGRVVKKADLFVVKRQATAQPEWRRPLLFQGTKLGQGGGSQPEVEIQRSAALKDHKIARRRGRGRVQQVAGFFQLLPAHVIRGQLQFDLRIFGLKGQARLQSSKFPQRLVGKVSNALPARCGWFKRGGLKHVIGGFAGRGQMLELGENFKIGGGTGAASLTGLSQDLLARCVNRIPMRCARLCRQAEGAQVIERGSGFGLDQSVFRSGLPYAVKKLPGEAGVIQVVAQMQNAIKDGELLKLAGGGPAGPKVMELKIVRIARLGAERGAERKKTNQQHVSQQVAHICQ